jgi:hypothetical protein
MEADAGSVYGAPGLDAARSMIAKRRKVHPSIELWLKRCRIAWSKRGIYSMQMSSVGEPAELALRDSIGRGLRWERSVDRRVMSGWATVVSTSYERGCQEKNSPSLPPRGRLSDLHPAQRCGLAANLLSLTRAVAGYISSVSCSDGGSTPSAREAAQAGLLAPDNMPTMILCETRGL